MFSGWIGFSQWIKKEFGRFDKKENGIYVPDDELVRLALITFEERRGTNFHFDLFMDVRKYGWEGVFRMNDEKWRDISKPEIDEMSVIGSECSQGRLKGL